MNLRPLILVVDDMAYNRALMQALLEEDYDVVTVECGESALRAAQGNPQPDLILLDIVMPGLNGYEVCQRLKTDRQTSNIPVVFLTANDHTEDEQHGLELGAVDYITKPISPPIVKARVHNHLALKASADFLRDRAAFLEVQVQKRTRELEAVQDVTIVALTSLAETRDSDTGNHIRRTQHYVRVLADGLKPHPVHSTRLTPSYISALFKSAPLHDIGKVGIPDRILLKPGKLTAEEFEIMKTHTTLGRDAIQAAEDHLGLRAEFLAVAKEIAYSHQEKWDGSGYPQGLSGENIPLSARLMALADVYDALISRRIYKAAMPHHEAVEVIRAGSGQHFDPAIVDAFMSVHEAFAIIAQRYIDTDADLAAKIEQARLRGVTPLGAEQNPQPP